jgi:hypothetical protein
VHVYLFNNYYKKKEEILDPFLFLPHFRLYRFVGYLLFPFCIKEEYKTNDSSTNRVADQRYFVKQNVHEFSSSPFYFQSLVLNLSILLSSIISLLCFVGIPFLEIFPQSLDVSHKNTRIKVFFWPIIPIKTFSL